MAHIYRAQIILSQPQICLPLLHNDPASGKQYYPPGLPILQCAFLLEEGYRSPNQFPHPLWTLIQKEQSIRYFHQRHHLFAALYPIERGLFLT